MTKEQQREAQVEEGWWLVCHCCCHQAPSQAPLPSLSPLPSPCLSLVPSSCPSLFPSLHLMKLVYLKQLHKTAARHEKCLSLSPSLAWSHSWGHNKQICWPWIELLFHLTEWVISMQVGWKRENHTLTYVLKVSSESTVTLKPLVSDQGEPETFLS